MIRQSTARKIWELLLPAERQRAVILASLMMIAMVLEMVGVGMVIPALALLTQSDIAGKYPALRPTIELLGNPDQQTLVIGGMLVLVGVYFVKNLFIGFLTWQQSRFAFGLQARLSQRLFTDYLRQPYTFHLQRNSAQLIRNATGEVNVFTVNAVAPMMLLLSEVLVLLGLGGMLLAVEPIGTLIMTCVMGVATWGFLRITRGHIMRWGAARQYHEGLRIQHLQQGLGGAKDVKLLGRETEFLEQYRVHNAQSARVGQLQQTLLQLPRLWLELLAVSGLAILVLTMLAQGRALEAVLPMLGLFVAAAFRLLPSVNRVLGAMQMLKYGLPVIDTLHAELNLLPSTVHEAGSTKASFQNTLELRDVVYAYPGSSEPVITNLSFTIHRGESIGFIGSSGAGKSTLVDILLGLLAPDSGAVLVDGEDIQQRLRSWQNHIGYVPQTIFLTDDTLRRNVAFGLADEHIDEAAVQRAIGAAQLEDFVKSLPEGLDTLVGERGVRLSGGQRQRVGIARALYHDPSVLVLDEATSSLDTATERGVMEAVRALQGEKTVLIVAHRLSTVEHCDRLYRLERGRVAQQGAPDAIFPNRAINKT
ncbi:ATPase [Sulfuricaulis limicola]|uniref:ATPase n=1 Tax=Sulfuricaulis limicola TaxID=1620215 RepID=A0A1B4XFD1_9GAMM|nr:ABC transporter ATP-binding protein [Sulfuricaulis limicola]BAV33511.1 ATPase [Sulfuricaulis limicola]